MANSTKDTAKKKTSGKKNSGGSNKSKQNKASGKGRTPKGKSEKTKYVGNDKSYTLSFSQRHYNAIMFSYFVYGALCLCVAFIPGYNLWEKFKAGVFSVFGISLYVVAVSSIVTGVRMVIGSLKTSLLVRNLSAFFSVSAFSGIIHLFSFSISKGGFDEWKEQFLKALSDGWDIGVNGVKFTGGMLGALFGGSALHTCGKAFGFIILLVVLCISVIKYLGIPFSSVAKNFSSAIIKSKSTIDTTHENHKIKRDERKRIREEQKELEREQLALAMEQQEYEREQQRQREEAEKIVEAQKENFDFNKTEIENDPMSKMNRAGKREIRKYVPENRIFTYPDGDSRNAHENIRSNVPKAEAEDIKYDNAASELPENYEEIGTSDFYEQVPDIEEIIPDTDLSESVAESEAITDEDKSVVQKAVRTSKATRKKNMDEVANYVDDKRVKKEYVLPPIDCLNEPKFTQDDDCANEMRTTAKKLVDVLKSFGVETKLIGASRGPSVTRYELTPAPGVKISKITNLSDDIALGLASSGVRIEAPIPNKSAVGIEVPNKTRATVTLREVISSDEYKNNKGNLLTVALGKDITGNISCADLAKMPHLLIAGTTGSGKSVCLNGMIASILYNATPSQVKLLMIDPKQVEFTVYNGIPHLLVPVISDARKAAGSLAWAVAEMDSRYKTFSNCAVRDIKSYNKYVESHPELQPMPQIVIFIDELNDLMMVSPKEVEDSICRLAQKARAAGMHLVVATQRPSVDVITGIIKANIPSRISLSVSSQVDSRTILDSIGAEKLLGNGDMLFNPVGVSKPVRIQGAFLSDEEIEKIVTFIKDQENAEYDNEIMAEIERNAVADKKKSGGNGMDASDEDTQFDPLLDDAMDIVTQMESASTTYIQRKLSVGYARAARIMDQLEQIGFISPAEGNKPRKALVTRAQYLEMKASKETPQEEYDVLSD